MNGKMVGVAAPQGARRGCAAKQRNTLDKHNLSTNEPSKPRQFIKAIVVSTFLKTLLKSREELQQT